MSVEIVIKKWYCVCGAEFDNAEECWKHREQCEEYQKLTKGIEVSLRSFEEGNFDEH